jgi:hypothetical protein
MKLITTLIVLICLQFNLYGQKVKISRTKFVAGLSAPELLHLGVTYRIANISLVGINAGLGPTWGGVWPGISLEHRLYFGKNKVKTNQKSWFCRQGTTFFPSGLAPQKFTFNLTLGKDILFKKGNNGITIDAGVFYLPHSEMSSVILVRSLSLWPALRFEFYFS